MFGTNIVYHSVIWLWNYTQFSLIAIWYIMKEGMIPRNKPHSIRNQMGRVAIITGSGLGIGRQTVAQMLELDMTVVLCGPVMDQLHIAVDSLRANGILRGKTHCLHLNLMEFESIKNFVEHFRGLKLPLNVLVNNAGIMFSPFKLSKDGYESQWQVNFLGHLMLTHLLLPDLKDSSLPGCSSRVVNLASCAHYMGQINWDFSYSKAHYNPQAAYAQSKLAIVMTTRTISKKLLTSGDNVLVNCVHPGVVASNLFENMFLGMMFPGIARVVLLTPKAGSQTSVHVALSDKITSGGFYYEDCTPVIPHKYVEDENQMDKLWNIACSSLSIEPSEFGKSK